MALAASAQRVRPHAALLCMWILAAVPPAALPQVQAAPAVAVQGKVRSFSMERTEQWTLRSKAGRTFEISISLPKRPAPATGYPMLYVLDAGTAFATLTETVRNHEAMFGPVVVVGIGYASDAEVVNRVFDLSPITDPKTLPPKPPGGWGAVGGADAFLAFLQDELQPVLGRSIAMDGTRRALFGHSLGGLFVLHVLFTHPEAFDTYIAGSPSIWWGNRQVLQEVPAFEALQARRGTPRRLLILVGELESGMSPEEARVAAAAGQLDIEEVRRTTNMVGNAAALATRLQPLAAHGLQVVFASFPNETHNSVIPAYLGRGARFTLSGWFNQGSVSR